MGGHAKSLPPALAAAAAAAYCDGEAVADIRARFGLSENALRRILRAEGVMLRNQPVPPAVIAQIRAAHEAGEFPKAIGDRLGMTKSQVANIIDRLAGDDEAPAEPQRATPSDAELRRQVLALKARRLGETSIAAMLRIPYARVAALAATGPKAVRT